MIPRYYSWILLLSTLFAPYPCHSLAPLNPRGQLNGNSRSFPDGAKKTKLSSSSTAALTASEEGASKPASISAATFNVIKACVGSGVLALPAGLALLTDRPQAYVFYVCIDCFYLSKVHSSTYMTLPHPKIKKN
jgi:hypothetical protein